MRYHSEDYNAGVSIAIENGTDLGVEWGAAAVVRAAQ
jgi:hypothetical protein